MCLRCGEFKHGAFNPCLKCGYTPDDDESLTKHLLVTDHYHSRETLAAIAARIKNGEPVTFDPESLKAAWVSKAELDAGTRPEPGLYDRVRGCPDAGRCICRSRIMATLNGESDRSEAEGAPDGNTETEWLSAHPAPYCGL